MHSVLILIAAALTTNSISALLYVLSHIYYSCACECMHVVLRSKVLLGSQGQCCCLDLFVRSLLASYRAARLTHRIVKGNAEQHNLAYHQSNVVAVDLLYACVHVRREPKIIKHYVIIFVMLPHRPRLLFGIIHHQIATISWPA